MNSLKKPVAVILLLAWGLALSGCITGKSGDTSIPWSRPADWENNVPGMSGGAMGNR